MWESGRVTSRWSVDARFFNERGVIFGGYLAALSDSALGMVTMSVLNANETFATSELRVSLFRPVRGGTLAMEAQVIHRSRNMVHAEVRPIRRGRSAHREGDSDSSRAALLIGGFGSPYILFHFDLRPRGLENQNAVGIPLATLRGTARRSKFLQLTSVALYPGQQLKRGFEHRPMDSNCGVVAGHTSESSGSSWKPRFQAARLQRREKWLTHSDSCPLPSRAHVAYLTTPVEMTGLEPRAEARSYS